MDASFSPAWAVQPPDRAQDTPRAPRPPRPGPVLMGDALTPAGGTTLLALLWQRWEEEARED